MPIARGSHQDIGIDDQFWLFYHIVDDIRMTHSSLQGDGIMGLSVSKNTAILILNRPLECAARHPGDILKDGLRDGFVGSWVGYPFLLSWTVVGNVLLRTAPGGSVRGGAD